MQLAMQSAAPGGRGSTFASIKGLDMLRNQHHGAVPMGNIDTQWFKDRIADKGLSLRGLAKLMAMSPSSLSLRISGTPEKGGDNRHYKISMEEAALMARFLGVPFDELVRRAGITPPRDTTRAVKVVGQVDQRGVVRPLKGVVVPRPGGLSDETLALKGVEGGWVYFYTPSKRLEPDAVGHLAVVENRWVGVLERGSERGLWNVRGVVEGVRVTSATPVLMIIP